MIDTEQRNGPFIQFHTFRNRTGYCSIRILFSLTFFVTFTLTRRATIVPSFVPVIRFMIVDHMDVVVVVRDDDDVAIVVTTCIIS